MRLRDLIVETIKFYRAENSVEYVVKMIEETHCGETVYIPKCEYDHARDRLICEQWDYLAVQGIRSSKIIRILSGRFKICEVRVWQIKHKGGERNG